MSDTKTIRIRNIPEDIHRQLKVLSVQTGQSMEAIVLDLIKNYLSQREDKGGK